MLSWGGGGGGRGSGWVGGGVGQRGGRLRTPVGGGTRLRQKKGSENALPWGVYLRPEASADCTCEASQKCRCRLDIREKLLDAIYFLGKSALSKVSAFKPPSILARFRFPWVFFA